MSRVVVNGLLKNYGSAPAVAGVDLDIEEGELVVLLGPSGCGKTTTLRCIAGLEEISGGSITVSGRAISGPGVFIPPERRQMGMVFQSYAIWPHLTVYQNLAFGLKLKGLSQRQLDEKIDTALDMVGLTGMASRATSEMSGGQQQRVAVARAIALEPQVLLFDEPLSNLDAKLREKMRSDIRQLQKRLGTTSIYVTHDQQEAMAIADRIVLMNKGAIQQIGTPWDIYNKPNCRFGADFIGLTNIIVGEVTSATGGSATVASEGISLTSAASGAVVGRRVSAVFRPEHIRVAADRPEGDNVFRARLEALTFLGSIADAYFTVQGHRLRVQISPPERWPLGHELWLRIPPESVLLLSET